MKARRTRKRRTGSVLVLSAVMMVLMIGIIALAVDLGYWYLIRTELQMSADSAALAATWDLITDETLVPVVQPTATFARARTTAGTFASGNLVGGSAPTLTQNDVVFGRLDPPFSAAKSLTFTDPSRYNATQVRIRRIVGDNGEVPTFFARLFGIASFPCEARATAAFVDNFSGFGPPTPGSGNLPIFPFALDQQTWNLLLNGSGSDEYGWDKVDQRVIHHPDGIPEANLFPQGIDSPGNRGTVNIGGDGNSTAVLSRQIREGVRASDLAALGKNLELGADGTLSLNGDTGVSAGMKDDVAAIVGETRVIPIFRNVEKPGNNADYTIVGFGGVRIMGVDLTGKLTDRYIAIQPARVEIHNGIPATDGDQHSQYIYAPVQLTQ
jgi:hypothetical protein